MALNYKRMKRIVERQIKNFGGTQNGALRRAGTDRRVSLVILDFSPREIDGNLIEYTDKRVLIEAENLATPPDENVDSLMLPIPGSTSLVEHRIAHPPKPLAPNGVDVLYWELVARK